MKFIYKLARRVLPQPLQRHLGNRHKVLRYTLDKLLFRFCNHPNQSIPYREVDEVRHMPRTVLEENPLIPEHIAASYRAHYSARRVQQIGIAHSDVIIEPTACWPMSSGRAIYAALYPAQHNPYLPTPPYASIWDKQPVTTLDKVISPIDGNGAGYFHLYSDLLARLLLCEKHGIDLCQYTLLLPVALKKMAVGQHWLSHLPLFQRVKAIHWQGDDYVHAREAIFPYSFSMPSGSGVFHEVINEAQAAHSVPKTPENKRIFLTRATHRRRFIRNMEALEAFVRNYGFDIADADEMSLPEQVSLFANTRYLIGIHGAGLTNMLYRYPHSLSLLELQQPDSAGVGYNPSYHNIAAYLGFDYAVVEGEVQEPGNMSFEVPLQRFEQIFKQWWQAFGE